MMKKIQQIPLDFALRPALGREDFLIGNSNKDAVGWIDKWPDWPAPVLILNGAAASGKSHLSAVWKEKTKAAVIPPEALLLKTAEDLSKTGSTVVIDGIDPWLGDHDAETRLFHLYNIFKEEKRTMLLTLRMCPTETAFAIPDLASRLRAAPLAVIHPPDDMLLGSLLIKQFADRQLKVSEDVILYLVPRMERSFAAARDIVETADKLALARKRNISIPFMRDVLAALQNI